MKNKPDFIMKSKENKYSKLLEKTVQGAMFYDGNAMYVFGYDRNCLFDDLFIDALNYKLSEICKLLQVEKILEDDYKIISEKHKESLLLADKAIEALRNTLSKNIKDFYEYSIFFDSFNKNYIEYEINDNTYEDDNINIADNILNKQMRETNMFSCNNYDSIEDDKSTFDFINEFKDQFIGSCNFNKLMSEHSISDEKVLSNYIFKYNYLDENLPEKYLDLRKCLN